MNTATAMLTPSKDSNSLSDVRCGECKNLLNECSCIFKNPTHATHFLQAAARHIDDRGVEYDKPQGERSMASTVTAFNALTGLKLTEEQGWLFMGVLKMARSQQGAYKADNYEDGCSYDALRGECAARTRKPQAARS